MIIKARAENPLKLRILRMCRRRSVDAYDCFAWVGGVCGERCELGGSEDVADGGEEEESAEGVQGGWGVEVGGQVGFGVCECDGGGAALGVGLEGV